MGGAQVFHSHLLGYLRILLGSVCQVDCSRSLVVQQCRGFSTISSSFILGAFSRWPAHAHLILYNPLQCISSYPVLVGHMYVISTLHDAKCCLDYDQVNVRCFCTLQMITSSHAIAIILIIQMIALLAYNFSGMCVTGKNLITIDKLFILKIRILDPDGCDAYSPRAERGVSLQSCKRCLFFYHSRQ